MAERSGLGEEDGAVDREMTLGEKVIACLLVVLIAAVVIVGVVAWRIHIRDQAKTTTQSTTTSTTLTPQQGRCSTTTSGQIALGCP